MDGCSRTLLLAVLLLQLDWVLQWHTDTLWRFPFAGIVGTVLTGGESSLPDFRDVISGAFKVSSPSSLSLRVPHYDWASSSPPYGQLTSPIFSSHLKFMTKGAKKGKDGPSTSSPHTAQLLTQVFCITVSALSMIEHQLHASTATTHQYKCFRSIISEKSCRCCRNQTMLLLSPLTVDLVSAFSDFPSFFWQINSYCAFIFFMLWSFTCWPSNLVGIGTAS